MQVTLGTSTIRSRLAYLRRCVPYHLSGCVRVTSREGFDAASQPTLERAAFFKGKRREEPRRCAHVRGRDRGDDSPTQFYGFFHFWRSPKGSAPSAVASAQMSGDHGVPQAHYLPLRLTTLPLRATPAIRLPAPHTYSDSLLVTKFL
jgi:hypothetical protein